MREEDKVAVVTHGSGAAALPDSSSAKPDPSSGALPPAKVPTAEASLAQSLPVILFWITMSCSVILFNKYLYMGTFKFPLTLTAIHMGFATLATSALKVTGFLAVPPSVQQGWRFWARNVMPIGLLFALSLGTSNLAAVRLTVSFIQMIKALTPMLALAISVAMKMETATLTLVAGERGGGGRHVPTLPLGCCSASRPFCFSLSLTHTHTLTPPPRLTPCSGQHHVRWRVHCLLWGAGV